MLGALPKEVTLNLKGPRLAWKQKRADISPRRRLLVNINFLIKLSNRITIYFFRGVNLKII